MKRVIATWVPSVSTDVIAQTLTWIVNGEIVKTVTMVPTADLRDSAADGITLREGDTVCVSIIARDELSASEELTGCVDLPIVPPDAPTDLIMKYMED
jgi:hypothetical protein